MKLQAEFSEKALIHALASQLMDDEIIDFIMNIDAYIGDSEFTEKLAAAVAARVEEDLHAFDEEVEPIYNHLDHLLDNR